jgi:ATP-binding cassette subfamily B protein
MSQENIEANESNHQSGQDGTQGNNPGRLEEKDFVEKIDGNLISAMKPYLAPFLGKFILLGMIMLLIGVFDGLFPFFQKYLVDEIILKSDGSNLVPFTILFSISTLLIVILVVLLIETAGRIETGLTHNIRQKEFRHLLELSMDYFHKTPAGWIISRFTSDVNRMGEVISWGMVSTFWSITMVFTMSIGMLILDWELALGVLAVFIPLVIISFFFQKKILHAQRQVRKNNSLISGEFTEGIQGAATSKTLAREEANSREFRMVTGRMQKVSVRSVFLSSLYLPIIVLLGSVATIIALTWGGVRLENDIIAVGTLVAFISYTVNMFDPIRELARIFSEFQMASAATERIVDFLDTPSSIRDREGTREKSGDPFATAGLHPRSAKPIDGTITFEDVHFGYSQEKQILTGFNLHLPKGKTYAFVGPTGSGKTTIVNLACRFYEPQGGSVRIDGMDYREHSQFWLHSQLGYVIQHPRLFADSVLENLRYGNPQLPLQKVVQAAKLFGAHEMISQLKEGYQTKLGKMLCCPRDKNRSFP